MRSTPRLTSMALLMLGLLASTACAHRPPPSQIHIDLAGNLRRPSTRPPRPHFDRLPPPEATGAAERAWLTDHVIKALLKFSVDQEANVSAEQDRADRLVDLIDATNRALAGQ